MDEQQVVERPTRRSGALVDYLARHLRRRSESALAPLGLRTRHLVALTVLRERTEITQRDLATVLVLDSTNVVGLLNELETRGLVERRRSAEDRRRHVVTLTDDGTTLLCRAETALAAVEDEVFAGLDPAQREQLHELLLAATGSASAPFC
ncbi:MarR family winged helix-turn-helix transcriptional regulator [Promicromonospora thailandica]|uniref:DNA-binding transcriptional regulator, MarR family n=1 Tax=Promicromonospora thailandica TaxID=765201 RepID=A0A9X2G0M0_9MICO|nr:MarR family winged helix-turn-helix transcriptional regulator [Promicromonospora thailandica]MCP2263795.1 DNA-binding transcriptional regulator, MarR family [Promicromonospora thailandica]